MRAGRIASSIAALLPLSGAHAGITLADSEAVAGQQPQGVIVAWGNQSVGVNRCDDFMAVAGGGYHSLGLRVDGSIVSWGNNFYGQTNVPAPNTGFVGVAAGGLHSLGLKADGSIVAWGDNRAGQADVPAPNTGFMAVAAGGADSYSGHSLGLKVDGSIVAWGRSNEGQTSVPEPNTGFTAVAAGVNHSLGLKADGSIVAWGCSGFNADSGQCTVPAPNTGFVAVSAGRYHSLGLKADGSIVAWGYNVSGQINVPAPNTDFVAVAAGGYHGLGLKGDGSVVVWGATGGQRHVPAPNSHFVVVGAGAYHSLAIRSGLDCNGNGSSDDCDIELSTSADCNRNDFPDECDIDEGAPDTDGNGIPDECDADAMPMAKIMVNPVPAKIGPPYPPLIGGGPNIVGNELRLDAGGVRVWVEVQLKDWDPNGNGLPGATFFTVRLDGSGLLDADINGDGSVTDDGDQEDIDYAMVPCSSREDCWTAFGERLPDLQCNYPGFPRFYGHCLPVYTAKGGIRSDGWCAPGGGGCSCGSFASYIDESGWQVYACSAADYRPDDGTVRWGATAVYDVPPGAKGKYTVELDTDRTYFLDRGGREIPSLLETGFVVNVLTGRCCFGSGLPIGGCVEGVTRAECDNQPPPVVFTVEAHCAPEGPNCQQVLGACCDGDPFGPCTNDTTLSACECSLCTWHQFQTCEDIDCSSHPIPTASDWGLAVLALLLMIRAKIVFGRHRRSQASRFL